MTICVKVIGGNFHQDFHHFSSKFHAISGYFYVHLKLMTQPPGKKASITKKCEMLINVEEIGLGLGSWKLAFRLILGWGIRWCTQNRKIFKTWYHLWRHSVPLGPKKCQMLINSEEIGLGSWKLAFRLILGWGTRWCTQRIGTFSKPGTTCDVTVFPWGPKSAKC